MAPNIYCPFCGVILLPDPYEFDNPQSPQVRVRPWYTQARGLYTTNAATDRISITGIGIVQDREILLAPPDSHTSYIDGEWGALEEWGIRDPDEGRWCFCFHDSCWRLLLLRLGHGRSDGPLDQQAIAESVFYQLYCTPFHMSSSFQFGHNYLGAVETHKPLGDPKPVDPNSFFYADPCAIPSAHELEMIATNSPKITGGPLQSTTTAANNADHHQGGAHLEGNDDRCSPPCSDDLKGEVLEPPGGRKPHGFERLPNELICWILSYLPFRDFLKMRLICHNLALFSKINAMPQSYWRSRFYFGQEADFLFPNLTDQRNWFLLFFGTKIHMTSGGLSLANRLRIRRLLGPIAVLVETGSTFRHVPHGIAVHPAHDDPNCSQLINDESIEGLPHFVNVVRSFSGQVVTIRPDHLLHEGCRVLYYRTVLYSRSQLSKPPHGQHQRRWGISMVGIGAQFFISGIDLRVSGECDASGGRLLGYHNPAAMKWVEIPSTTPIRALGVAFRSGGLTGLNLISPNSYSSGWVGVSNGPGVSIGTLVIPEGRGQYCLLAGLDHLKIVSLGFGELADHCEGHLELPCASIQDLSRVYSHLWTPPPPGHENLTIGTILPRQPSQAFEPLINIDFGGPQGVLLGSLTRLAFHMASRPYPLMGIEVSYSDGRYMLFGSRSGCVLSVFVNGPEGERINHIGIFEHDLDDYSEATTLDGLRVSHIVPKTSCIMLILTQVSTNFGRMAAFAPLHTRSNAVTREILAPPHGHTITGFTAVERKHHGGLTRVGIQSQPCGEQPPIPSISNHECHLAREDQLQYDVVFTFLIRSINPDNFQTYASLKNVRRIQASTGIEGRSRSTTHIAGLKLEYHGHPSPGIVGQWMSLLDDSFELSPGEDIQTLTTWLTPMDTSTEPPTMKFGQVVAIHIETTRSRSVMFRSPGFHSLPPRKLRSQYRASSGETLTAISWIINATLDSVRAVITANTPARRAQIPIPEPNAPFDQICKLDFERLPTPDSTTNSRDPLATAEAYYGHRAIIGLAFTYTSGSKASIGDQGLDLDTVTRKAIHFAPHARIVGLFACIVETGLTELAFKVKLDQPAQSRYETLVLANTPPGVDPVAYGLGDVWSEDDGAFVQQIRHPGFPQNKIFVGPAQTRLVGMYVGCRCFQHVGLVYEPEDVLEDI
ncbi:hypothetical protein P168DRAFT_323700 [Aspergillus campestris IBT 28561]|uniref:F-box domain-containing protein n=1 Tax=Aspergillus campestris (strain IBT 28561) TaxID=1392248 RepID=A0A2I1DFE2_ASPC2|nr:uncharacterized protein P168DRAFT_323700 [Aspergillus campestris IBT 28561]PKY08597.1 hypothetical protein P168DRAFT_323700 [Aspergillus campestris IBT 28561]